MTGADAAGEAARRGRVHPALGVAVAIAITATMDATGLSAWSALPLLPLLVVFARLDGLRRRDLGLTWGKPRHLLLAALFPAVVLALVGLVAALAGATDLAHARWGKAALNFVLIGVTNFLVVIVTEEGFFRGWLWASLARRGLTTSGVLAWTSLAFAAWHVSAVTLPTGFDVPAAQVPVFLANAAVLGATWGMLRARSGSAVVASLSHGLWNGGAYALFAFGTRVGALGVRDTAIFGPEVGVVGLVLNLLFALALWRGSRAKSAAPSG